MSEQHGTPRWVNPNPKTRRQGSNQQRHGTYMKDAPPPPASISARLASAMSDAARITTCEPREWPTRRYGAEAPPAAGKRCCSALASCCDTQGMWGRNT